MTTQSKADKPPVKPNNHEEPTAIVPAPAITALPERGADAVLKRAEEVMRVYEGILKLIARKISPLDVMIFGNEGENESAYFNKRACKRILEWIGADLIPDGTLLEKRYDGPEGPYIDFEVHGTLVLPDGRRVGVMGNRATYDDFFAQRTRWICPNCQAGTVWDAAKHGSACPKCGPCQARESKYYLPLTEVDIPAVKQAAITNFWNHAVQDAGFAPSLEELKAAGMDISRVNTRVTFRKGKKPPQKPQAAPATPPAAKASVEAPVPAQAPPNAGNGAPVRITDPQRKRLWAIARSMKWVDDEIEALIGRYGFKASGDVTRDKYEEIIRILQAGPQQAPPTRELDDLLGEEEDRTF